MSENKVTFGLEQVHIAFIDDANPVQPAWETPVPIPGAVRWTPTVVGESTPFYADNTVYFTFNVNNGYTGELEMANVPDAIKAKMLGWEIDSNGALIELSNAQPKPFALLGQVLGDKRNRRFVYYYCTASRPAKERTTTNESTTPATDVLNLTVSPVKISDKMVVKADMELSATNSSAYNAFFSAVTVPASVAVNKAALSNAIAVAGSLTEADYTTESWDAFEAALTTATTVNGNVHATQNQVDAALSGLQHAMTSLVVDA